MIHSRPLVMPWAHRWGVYSTPGSLILKLALGAGAEHVPTNTDIRSGAHPAAAHLDMGPVDRVLGHFSDQVQVSRVHGSARSLGRVGMGHRGYDETEHAIGLSRTFQVDVDDDCNIGDLIDALRHLGVVEYAHPHYLWTTPFETAPASFGVEEAWEARDRVRASEALAYEPGDPAVIVAVVDTGVTLEHPELEGRLRRGCDTVELVPADVPSGVRLLDAPAAEAGDPEDAVGHGTSCAAIMGATGAQIPPGLAGACSLLPIRVLGAALFPGKEAPVGIGAITDIDCGVKNAIDLGAKVLNMSFGTPQSLLGPDDPPPHGDVVRYGLARGCVMVAASGNSGKAEAFSPACLDGVLAVGAADRDGRPAAFSTQGPHVAVGAPGVEVVTAGLRGYARVTGTSFAAPFVTAAAALLVSRAERRAFPLDAYTVHRVLRASARPWAAGAAGQGNGAGVLDAHAALTALDRIIDQRAVRSPAAGRPGRESSGELLHS
jgi:subtilisin family serine protease